jgi:uncharacterized protein
MQKGVVTFDDLKEGMVVTGKVKNVVDFGAFVDLGIKETALLHVSEMADHFIKDPLEVLKVGDIREFRIIELDTDRRRISLSLKSQSSQSASATPASEKKKVVTVKREPVRTNSRPSERKERNNHSAPRYSTTDDGTMYNPFAEAFRNLQNKKK